MADAPTTYDGGCHCGALELTLETELEPDAIEVRACQCSFCRKHGSRALSDPAGRATVTVRDPSALREYVFGLKTARYLVCGNCGVYVAAVTTEPPHRAIVIVNALTDQAKFSRKPVPSVYDEEDRDARRARRTEHWMPVTIVGDG